MPRSDNLHQLPSTLPIPTDDGACDHLPTFNIAGMRLIKRITLILNGGVIEKVFYPVFPPDKNADEVIEWLSVIG